MVHQNVDPIRSFMGSGGASPGFCSHSEPRICCTLFVLSKDVSECSHIQQWSLGLGF